MNYNRLDSLLFLNYNIDMRTIKKTEVFDTWLSKLKDKKEKTKITDRIIRLKKRNKRDHHIIDKDIYKLRIHHRLFAMARSPPQPHRQRE